MKVQICGGLDIRFLAEAYRCSKSQPGEVTTAAVIAANSKLGGARYVEQRLADFLACGVVTLHEGRYSFDSEACLRSSETFEMHMLATWDGIFLEREQECR